MKYTNDKIEQLIAERNDAIQKYNRKIQNEIDKEKAKHKFSFSRFSLLIGGCIFIVMAFELNKKMFPKTSIWSWEYYLGESR